MFADDTYITTAHEDISTIECSLNIDLTAVHNWLKTNKLSCKTCKTSYMTIGSRQNLTNAKFMNLELDIIDLLNINPLLSYWGFILMKC